MSLEPGGFAEKVGNRFESSWVTFQLLMLLDEKISYIQVEPLGTDEDAVDVIIGNIDGSKEHHQCKIGHLSNDAWTLSTLQSKELLTKGFEHILSGSKSYKVVSRIGFRLLEDLCESARHSTGSSSDFFEYQIKQISQDRIKLFTELCTKLGLDSSKNEDLDNAFQFLKAFEIKKFNEDDLDNDLLVLMADKLVNEPPKHLIHFLQTYPVKCEKLRAYITIDALIKDLERNQFTFKSKVLEKNSSVLLVHLARLASENNSYFFVTGTKQKISIQQLLPMHLEKIPFNFDNYKHDVSTALSHYYKTTEREKNGISSDYLDSPWIGRFIKQVVVVAGPGLGKSTMIKELAYQYANENFLVLKVDLKKLARSLKNGETFIDAVSKIGLDGSGFTFNEIKNIDIKKWVILADGLDECSGMHEEVSIQIKQFSIGHPNVRIIITTRPIGYNTAEFEHWTHYRLLPPIKDECFSNLVHLMQVIDKDKMSKKEIEEVIKKKLHRSYNLNAISNSPQLLGMATLLVKTNHNLAQTKVDLYKQLIELYKINPKFNNSNKQETYDLIINIIGFKLIDNPLINFSLLIQQCAECLTKYINKTKFECAELIREAIINWEQVGLIEQINYQQTSIITFTHKTFSEFLAARYLCEANDETLFEQLVDRTAWNEVIDFSIAMGLADKFIKLKINQYHSGKANSIQAALALLKKYPISNSLAKELGKLAVLSIDSDHKERFSIGLVLLDLFSGENDINREIINDLKLEIRTKLDTENIHTLLIVWAIIVEYDLENFDFKFSTRIYKKLADNINIPSVSEAIKNIINDIDRSDLELLQNIAFATLKKQPDEEIKIFYDTELKNKEFFTFGFKIRVDQYLESKGIPIEKSTIFNGFLSKKSINTRSLTPTSERLSDVIKPAFYAIANAIIDINTIDSIIESEMEKFPQLSALLTATNFLKTPFSDIHNWEKTYNIKTFKTTMKTIIEILPIDNLALINEARKIINYLNKIPDINLLYLLPNIDIPEIELEQIKISKNSTEDIKDTLFHPSEYAAKLAFILLAITPLSKDELLELIVKASGFSYKLIILLIYQNCSDSLWEILSYYLDTKPIVDLYYFFEGIKLLDIEPKSIFVDKIINSDNEAVLAYKNNIIEYWNENEIINLDSEIT